MRKPILRAGITLCLFAFQACNDSGNNKMDTVDSAKQMNDSARKTADTSSSAMPLQAADKISTDFAVKAASGGMMEVQLGKIAQNKAVNPRVKQFGAMMEKDHSKANDDLMMRAKSQNISLPANAGEEEQKMINKISMKTGKDFDKAYMDMMLSDHNTDIAAFKDAAAKCTNAAIKDFALQTLPILEKHLDAVKAITGKQ